MKADMPISKLGCVLGIISILLAGVAVGSYLFPTTFGDDKPGESKPNVFWRIDISHGKCHVTRTTQRLFEHEAGSLWLSFYFPEKDQRIFYNLLGTTWIMDKQVPLSSDIPPYGPHIRRQYRAEVNRYTVWVSIWPLCLVFAVATIIQMALRIRRRRRLISGLYCLTCNYCLFENHGHVCPECGFPIPEGQRRKIHKTLTPPKRLGGGKVSGG